MWFLEVIFRTGFGLHGSMNSNLSLSISGYCRQALALPIVIALAVAASVGVAHAFDGKKEKSDPWSAFLFWF